MLTQEKNRLGTAHKSVIPLIKEHMNYLNKEIKRVRNQIADLIDQNPNLRQKKELLGSIPGIGKATTAVILVELDNLEKFNHVRELVAFVGLAPRETLSGSPIKGKSRLCKIGHARLRKALYMPALVSIQCNPVMIAFYNRLKEKGKNGKVIVCAIMRKLVHIIFGILKSAKSSIRIINQFQLDKNSIYKSSPLVNVRLRRLLVESMHSIRKSYPNSSERLNKENR